MTFLYSELLKRYEKLMEMVGGQGTLCNTADEVRQAVEQALGRSFCSPQ
jgi:hypothetical protein